MRLLFLAILLPILSTTAALAGAGRPGSSPAAKVAVGQSAPDFTLNDLLGKPVQLSSLKGKVVFLNFWASWCPPCRAEMPAMERLNEALGGKNFAMLAVNAENDLLAVKAFLAKNPHSFPVLLDPEAKAQNLYGVYRFPETFLIDRQGKIVQHYLGARDWSSVEFLKYVTSLMNE